MYDGDLVKGFNAGIVDGSLELMGSIEGVTKFALDDS